MAKMMRISSFPTVLIMIVALSLSTSIPLSTAALLPDPVKGLSWDFYKKTCPKLETIVWSRVQAFLTKDITDAAGLLRIHYHDCFVQGCDGSVLLNSTTGELVTPPNLSLRASALAIINDLKENIEASCPGVVSCADLATLAARDSIRKAGGPFYSVPLGRRDGLKPATSEVVLANLPPPSANVTGLMNIFGPLGFTTTDLVALSGAHTIGRAHCSAFRNRLFNNTIAQQDVNMEANFAKKLYQTCPTSSTVNTTVNDIITPNIVDNKYYIDLTRKQTLFTSDQSLFTDSRTKATVTSFATNQTKFFERFVLSMIKMGQLNVLTGAEGEIRKSCWTANPSKLSIMDEDVASVYSS